MNKAELINAIAEEAGLSKIDAKKALDAVVKSISDALVSGDKVSLIGFGTFSGPGTFYIDNVVFYNGVWTFTNGINDVLATPAINCYMNSGKLNVSCQSEMSEVTVRNLLGQNLRTEVANANSKVIDLSGLASGNYIVVAKMANGLVSTQKFVK